jgi:Fe-S oxidoreductase
MEASMLTLLEKFLFVLAVLISLWASTLVAIRINRTILRGKGAPDLKLVWERIRTQLVKVILLLPTFRLRFWTSLFHALVAWGFLYYLLVNFGDILEAFFPNLHFLGKGSLGNLYRFGADVLSVGVLVGMLVLIIRRWVVKPADLSARKDILLQPSTRRHIQRDSAIVAVFILVHVGSRFLGASVNTALEGSDPWQPFASAAAGLFAGLPVNTLIFLEHLFFWTALGTILLFLPYFLISKHVHLFFAPLNYLLKPPRLSMGELDKIDFEDESLEQFGATRLEDLGWEQIMDAYACIMCYRCQQVCPAYNTGKVLSPAALEINKRYLLNAEGGRLAKGEPSSQSLAEALITPEAIWACTACGACIDICPVGNEPMRDILDIRRSLVLMENSFPKQLQAAFRGMERAVNPWNVSPSERMVWAQGLRVPTIEENPDAELLWWVGCAPATDARAQKTAQAFASILNAAGVNYAVLGENEQCTGDSARRAGREDIFFELATANVEILNEVNPQRIVTTCPHCLHTIKNEYPAFGGNYSLIHHSQLIEELITDGKIKISATNNPSAHQTLAFHDPCYLGRQNGILEAPRQVLQSVGEKLVELPRHGRKSFCCGAGGAQMWKEEEHGTERVSFNRIQEARSNGITSLAVGCPFCLSMLEDARKDTQSAEGNENELQLLDIAEVVAGRLADY